MLWQWFTLHPKSKMVPVDNLLLEVILRSRGIIFCWNDFMQLCNYEILRVNYIPARLLEGAVAIASWLSQCHQITHPSIYGCLVLVDWTSEQKMRVRALSMALSAMID